MSSFFITGVDGRKQHFATSLEMQGRLDHMIATVQLVCNPVFANCFESSLDPIVSSISSYLPELEGGQNTQHYLKKIFEHRESAQIIRFIKQVNKNDSSNYAFFRVAKSVEGITVVFVNPWVWENLQAKHSPSIFRLYDMAKCWGVRRNDCESKKNAPWLSRLYDMAKYWVLRRNHDESKKNPESLCARIQENFSSIALEGSRQNRKTFLSREGFCAPNRIVTIDGELIEKTVDVESRGEAKKDFLHAMLFLWQDFSALGVRVSLFKDQNICSMIASYLFLCGSNQEEIAKVSNFIPLSEGPCKEAKQFRTLALKREQKNSKNHRIFSIKLTKPPHKRFFFIRQIFATFPKDFHKKSLFDLLISKGKNPLTPSKEIFKCISKIVSPTAMTHFFGEKALTLANKDLYFLPPQIRSLSSFLRTLCLNGNHLQKLPVEIGYLPFLAMLSVDDNALTSFPSTIGRLRSLRVLSARNNRIAGLPDTILNLTKLEYLCLANNRLKSVPEGLLVIPNQVPDLRGNSIESYT
ncbi:MAG: leucine-rich repeat domain-containing protein [Chlamydiota bacterium]